MEALKWTVCMWCFNHWGLDTVASQTVHGRQLAVAISLSVWLHDFIWDSNFDERIAIPHFGHFLNVDWFATEDGVIIFKIIFGQQNFDPKSKLCRHFGNSEEIGENMAKKSKCLSKKFG